LFNDRVTTLGAQGRLDGICQNVDAAEHPLAGLVVETDFFGGHYSSSEKIMVCVEFELWRGYCRSTTAMTSSSRMTMRSSLSTLTSVPLYLPKSTRSPALMSGARVCPFSRTLPWPT